MNYKMLLIALLCFITYGKSINGQITNERLAISPKIGLYAQGGVVYGAELNAVFNKTAFSLEYFYLDEFNILGPSPDEHFHQIGFMVGRHFQKEDKKYCFQIQGGIAPIWGLKRTVFLERRTSGFLAGDIYQAERISELGLALKMGVKFDPMDELGIGFDIQANINRRNSILMFLLSIEMGKL